MMVQLNEQVCGSDLKRGHSGDGCLTSSILFKYERSMGHLFVLSWARVWRVARGSVVSEWCTVSMVFVLILASSMVLGFASMSVV